MTNFLIICAILIGLVLSAGYFIGRYFYNFSLNRYTIKGQIFKAPHNIIDPVDEDERAKKREANESWLRDTGNTLESIRSFDGLNLVAHQVRNDAGKHRWAIVLHGYTARGLAMVEAARHFYGMGFSVLFPDARGHGEGEGDYIGMGWHDRLDVLRWIEHILSIDKDAEILVYGISMGGGCAMMTSGEKLPANVKAFVEDCGYASVWDEFAYQGRQLFRLPPFPITHFASLYTKWKAGYSFKQASAVKQVAKSKTPTLFIHGSEDTFVPAFMLDKVYHAAACPKERLLVEGAGHGGALIVLGEAYWATIRRFIDGYFDWGE